jgi:hypothetical protein
MGQRQEMRASKMLLSESKRYVLYEYDRVSFPHSSGMARDAGEEMRYTLQNMNKHLFRAMTFYVRPQRLIARLTVLKMCIFVLDKHHM